MSQSSNNRFLSSPSSSSSTFSSSFMASSSSKYVPPGKKYNDRFQRPNDDNSFSSRPNRFLKASSFKSSGSDGWKTSNSRQNSNWNSNGNGNRFSYSNRGYRISNNRKEPEKKLGFTSSEGDFPTLGGGSAANVTQKKPQNTLNYSNAINEDIEKHKKNKPPPPKKFVSLVSLKKKKKDDDFVFEEDFEREEEYVETTYFTEDEEEYYEDEEELRRAEQDYDY